MTRDVHDELSAIARTAAAASAGVGPEVVTELRRRRRVRRVGQGAGIAVLAAGAIAAAGPIAAWLAPPTTPPADGPTVVEPGPTDVEPVEPAPSVPEQTTPTPDPASMECGATDDWLREMADPVVHPVPIGVTAAAPSVTLADQPPYFTPMVSATTPEPPDVELLAVAAVVTQDGVIVGHGTFRAESGPAALDGTFVLDRALSACPTGTAATDDGLLAPGDYGLRVVVTARDAGAGDEFLAIGGPWALTVAPAGSTVGLPDAEGLQAEFDALFTCGEPGPSSIHTLPTGPLALAADLPEVGYRPVTGVLGTTGGDSVEALLASNEISVAFVGSDGLVVGFLSGVGESVVVDIPSDGTVQLGGRQSLTGCGPDGRAYASNAEEGLPPDTYTLWPYVAVQIRSVTSAEGETVVHDAGWSLVVGNPHEITTDG